MISRYLLLIALVIIESSLVDKLHGSKISPKSQDSDLDIRLTPSLKPHHYLVRLQPLINGNFSFNGYVEITFNVTEETNEVILHISDIITKNETTKIYYLDDPSKQIGIESQKYHHENQFYIAALNDSLKRGQAYVLSLEFQGYLNTELYGFYRSSYKDENNETTFLATTKFEPTGARKAFPCFDEPAFKAKFSIEMIRPENLHTISNMPLMNSTPVVDQKGWVLDRFNTSFPMSTYLVAFVVSDFGYIEGEGDQKYKFRVWARQNALSTAKYAVELGPKVSRFYEKYFKVPFPLPKQDLAAIPDFSSGAMENWGLITFRESSMLYDPEVAKARDKINIANTITHELSHQWFGDLVTPSWWTDLWLNEGFASYMEYLGLRDTEPSLNSMNQFVVDEVHSALSLDSLETSHPISVEVQNPDQIKSLFDTISYSKGASIIRMMSGFLSEKSFTNGLADYLTQRSYQNAAQDDLWNYLTKAGHSEGTLDSNMTVKEIMDTWTLQKGYPVLTVKRNSDGSATFSQQRFLLQNASKLSSNEPNYKWWIPLTFTTQSKMRFNDTTPEDWMSPSESTKVIPGVFNNDKWIIVNLDQVNYYRVNYDEANWIALSLQLENDPNVFPDANRAQMIDDSFNLARAGQLSYFLVLDLMKYLKKETQFAPISAAFNNFAYIRSMFSSTEKSDIFKNYFLSLIIPLYNDVKFGDSLSDPPLVQRKRELILSWACDLDHSPCVDAAVDLYKQWMKNPNNTKIISPNLKSTVYCTAIRKGGKMEWDFAWSQFLATNSATEQKELLQSLGCSEDIGILKEYLNRSLSPSQGIKSQMTRYIFPAVSRSSIGSNISFEFIRTRWNDLFDLFASVNFVLNEIVSSVTESLNTREYLNKLMTFKKENAGKLSSAKRAVDQAIENAKNNIQWMKLNYGTIVQWLESNGYKN